MEAMDKVLQICHEKNDCKENVASPITKCSKGLCLYHPTRASLVHDDGNDINEAEVRSQHGKLTATSKDLQEISTAEYKIIKEKLLDKISKKFEEINDRRTKTTEETENHATNHTPNTSSSKGDIDDDILYYYYDAIDEFVETANIPETASRSQVPKDSLPEGRLRFPQLRYGFIATSTSSEGASSYNPFIVDDYDENLNPFRDDELNETSPSRSSSDIIKPMSLIRTDSDANKDNTTHTRVITHSFTEFLQTFLCLVILSVIIYHHLYYWPFPLVNMLKEAEECFKECVYKPKEPFISLTVNGEDIFAKIGNSLKIF